MPRAKIYIIQHVYHLVDKQNWDSIQATGLLSAAKLLERTGLSKWIRCQRTENMQLADGVVIRDQCPIPASALRRCLAQNLTPADWYAELNRRVFFWIDLERLKRQQRACTTPQHIMTIDAQKLLACYGAQAAVTPFNTGNARRAAARRSLASFVPYQVWQASGWLSEAVALSTKPRLATHKSVELTILDAVPDIFNFVVAVK